MKVLIKQATIIDPLSTHHQLQHDILISDGIIRDIQPNITETAEMLIEQPGLYVAPGWIDIFADFGDPGFEFRESLETGAAAAAAGGFTTVMLIPNTRPVVDNKAQVEYLVNKSRSLPVNIIPIGAVTKNAAGSELAEMYDMHTSGAVSFSDGIHPLQSAGMMVKALQYVKSFDGVIIQVPDDKTLVPHGLMNEGVISTRLGLAGKPIISEELVVARDIKLARYAASKLHFTAVTSLKSMEYIRRAKDGGIQVTCSVTPYHLFFCDEDLFDYDTNLKVNPPLRTRSDMMGLRKALEEGYIDCIASHHSPHDYDSKIVEFEYAKNGMTGLETCYSVLRTVLPDVSEERWNELLCTNAAKIFGLPRHSVLTGNPAALTLYRPNSPFMLTEKNTRSRSRNSPFIGKSLNGQVTGVINRENVFLN